MSNEKSNTVTVIDTGKFEAVRTIKVGQRPRGIALTKDGNFVLVAVGDDDTIEMIDTGTNQIVGTLPSGPDPELFVEDPTGKLLYVANENDNAVTIIDLTKRARLGDIPVGVEPEGMGISPDGKILVNTSETTNMAHFIDPAARRIVANVLVGARPRFAEFKADGSELWVSAEVGGNVSIIDPVKHVVTENISFAVPGLRSEAIQPVGIPLSKDGKTGFVALGPANRVAVIDAVAMRSRGTCWLVNAFGISPSHRTKSTCSPLTAFPMTCRSSMWRRSRSSRPSGSASCPGAWPCRKDSSWRGQGFKLVGEMACTT